MLHLVSRHLIRNPRFTRKMITIIPDFKIPSSASAITQITTELIDESKKNIDKVANSKEKATFDSVIRALADDERESSLTASSLTFGQYVSTDESIRNESQVSDKKLRDFSTDQSMREDVYARVKAVMEDPNWSQGLDAESIRLAEKLMLDFKRAGLALSKEDQEKVKEIKKRISTLSIEFNKNINNDKTSRKFTKEQLEGMPDDWLAGLQKEGDEYVVTMKYPDIIPLLKHCKNAETRRIMDEANATRCMENIGILEETVKLRAQEANIMGYKNHADFVLEICLAKNPDTAVTFLSELRTKLEPLGKRELEKLLELKKQECAERGEPFDGKINAWDYNYYSNMLLEKEYAVDELKIREYFPLEHVLESALQFYRDLLGINFILDPAMDVWHPDVRGYHVTDVKTGKGLGTMYLDLHPRDNKFTHAAVFPLIPGCQDGENRRGPVVAMVCNFSKGSPESPALLKHSEVVTFLHELGHAVHGLCSSTKYSRFHGTSVERDLVEAPSQMLENWCYEPTALAKMSKHYQTGEPLPKEMVDALIKSRNVNGGLFNLRQLFFGTFDLSLHTAGPDGVKDIPTLWDKLRKEVTLIDNPAGNCGASTFGHMYGYSARYYSYLYSLVFAADLFDSFKKNNFSKDTGLKYRNKILQPGGSIDGMDILVGFLGRKPENGPFLRQIGLEDDVARL